MPIYRVIRKSDGEIVYEYSADSPIEWVGMELTTHDHVEYEPPAPEPNPVIQKRRLTKLEFIAKLGKNFDILFEASKNNTDVEKFMKMLDWATPDPDGTSIDLDDPRVSMALTLFENAGLLAPGAAQEILNG